MNQKIAIALLLSAALKQPAWSDRNKALKLDTLDVPAPDFMVDDLSGKRFHLKELIDRQNTVLHLWATWCVPCMHEMPELAHRAEAWNKHGVRFIAVSVDPLDSRPHVAQHLTLMQIKLPVFVAEPSAMLKPFQAWGIPMTYFIDEQGNIRARAMGDQKWSEVADDQIDAVFGIKPLSKDK